MKELSIQEKATRYDEALKEAVIAHKDEDRHLKATLERIFPELKESEDEKWIPKEIIKYLKEKGDFRSCWIAWLEKQGEQKIKTPEESLGIDSDTYNKIVDECIYGEQKPASWSKEDEKQARQIERIVHDGCTQKLQKQIADWFESLKERYTWKPSEDQMNTLEYYMHTLICNEHKEVLFGLYADLKKLSEK